MQKGSTLTVRKLVYYIKRVHVHAAEILFQRFFSFRHSLSEPRGYHYPPPHHQHSHAYTPPGRPGERDGREGGREGEGREGGRKTGIGHKYEE